MHRPLIGIPAQADFRQGSGRPIYCNNRAYVHAVERAGGVPVLIPLLDDLSSLDTLLPRLDGLFSIRERPSGIEYPNVVVVFFVNRGPIGQPFCDWVWLIGKTYRYGFLCFMSAGLEAEIFKPQSMGCARRHRVIGIADTIGVHCAMEIHAGDATSPELWPDSSASR